MGRRDCVQNALFGEFGLDTLREYFVMGCKYRALYDFERWAGETGCGSEPYPGVLDTPLPKAFRAVFYDAGRQRQQGETLLAYS